jgi:hypothetical protein
MPTAQEHIASYMNRPMTERDIRRIVAEMVPTSILNMGQSSTAVGTDGPIGDDELVFLGYRRGHGVWRNLPVWDAPVDFSKCEWSQSVDTDNEQFIVKQGPVMWSNVCVNTKTPLVALEDQGVPYGGVSDADVRCLYIEITLSTSVSTSNATAVLGDNGYYPIDDPSANIVRWPLSQWSFAVADGVITPTRTAWPWPFGRPPVFHTSFGPPLGS